MGANGAYFDEAVCNVEPQMLLGWSAVIVGQCG